MTGVPNWREAVDDRRDGAPDWRGGSEPRVSMRGAFASNFLDAATLGFGDEIAGGIEARDAAARGEDAGAAYRRRVREARERLRLAREQRPVTSFAGGITGAGATLALPGVRALASGGGVKAAGQGARGARLLRQQVANGVRGGAIFGGIYGAGSGQDTVESRLGSAASGAAWGAGLGGAFSAVAPAAGEAIKNATRPVRRTIANALRNPMQLRFANPNQLNSSIGVPPPPRAAPPAPPAEPPIPNAAVAGVDRVMRRQNMSFDDLAARINEADANPQGRVLADVLGDQGNAKAAALAQAPGQTGAKARTVADERAKTLPGRLVNDLMSRLGVSKSPTEALRALQNEYRQASVQGYAPVLAQKIDDAAANAKLEPVLARLPERIRAEADQVVDDLARLDGVEAASFTTAQRLHYLKMAIDDAVSAVVSKEGFKGATRGALARVRADFLRTLDEVIPGYAQVRQRWGSLKEAEEALEEGARVFSMRPEALRARLDEMTAFERAHFRIGAADEIAGRVFGRGKAVGHANAAEALNSVETQNIVRELFDSPDQAARFIENTNVGNQLLRNAQAWVGGSDTVKKAAQLADDGVPALIDRVGEFASAPVTGLKNAAQSGVRFLAGGQLERVRNEIGRALMTAIDNGDEAAEAYLRQLLDALRKRSEQRAASVAEQGRAGALGAVGASDDTSGMY